MSTLSSSSAAKPAFGGRILSALVFLALTLLYSASSRGVWGPIEGSQLALTLAMAREGRFAINAHAEYTQHASYAFFQGNIYSDRPPGLSLLAVPLDWISGALSANEPERNARSERLVNFIPALAGAGAVIVLVDLLLALGVSAVSAWIAALIFALASLHWRYSTVFMGHSALAFTCALAWLLTVLPAGERTALRRVAFGFLLGFGVLLRYEGAIFVPLFLLAWWLTSAPDRLHTTKRWRAAGEVLLGLAAPLAFLAFYHTVCFGAPWETFSQHFAPERNYWDPKPEWGRQGGGFAVAEMLSNPLYDGIRRVLFQFPGTDEGSLPIRHRQGITWGIFILQPVLFFGLLGMPRFLAQRPKIALTQLLMFLALLLATAKNQSLAGGAMHDPRYLVPALFLLCVPLAFLLDQARELFPSAGRQQLYWFVLHTLAIGSALMCLVHLAERESDSVLSPLHRSYYVSYISREFLRDLLWTVFHTGAPLGAAALAALIVWATAAVLRRAEGPRAALLVGASAAALTAGSVAAAAYAYFGGDGFMARYSDSVLAGTVPALRAGQRDSFPIVGERARQSTPKRVRQACRQPVLVQAPAELRFSLRPDITMRIWASQPLPRGNLRRARGRFSISSGGERPRVLRIGGRRPWRRITVRARQPLELVLDFGNGRAPATRGIWCVDSKAGSTSR